MAMKPPAPPVSKRARTGFPSTSTASVNGRAPTRCKITIGTLERVRGSAGGVVGIGDFV